MKKLILVTLSIFSISNLNCAILERHTQQKAKTENPCENAGCTGAGCSANSASLEDANTTGVCCGFGCSTTGGDCIGEECKTYPANFTQTVTCYGTGCESGGSFVSTGQGIVSNSNTSEEFSTAQKLNPDIPFTGKQCLKMGLCHSRPSGNIVLNKQ